MMAIKKYSCRYILPDKPVYAIVRHDQNNHMPLHRAAILSTDFHNNSSHVQSRVIVAVQDPTITSQMIETIDQVSVIETNSKDLAYVASLMKMSAVVLIDINREQETFELHYVSHK